MSPAIKWPPGSCKMCQGSSNKTELFLPSLRPLLEGERAVLKQKDRLLQEELRNGRKLTLPIKLDCKSHMTMLYSAAKCTVKAPLTHLSELDFWSIIRGLSQTFCSLHCTVVNH